MEKEQKLKLGLLVSYDIDNFHTEVKNELVTTYSYVASPNNGQLPNTTVIKLQKITPSQGMNDLQNAIKTVVKAKNKSITLEKAVAAVIILDDRGVEVLPNPITFKP